MGKTASNSKEEVVARTTKYTKAVREMALETQGHLFIERKEVVSFDDAVNFLIKKGFENSFGKKSVA